MLGDLEQLRPRDPAEVVGAMRETASRQDDPAAAVRAIRGVRRHELLRTAFADLLRLADVDQVCAALSATTASTLDAALEVAGRDVAATRGLDRLPIRFAVLAMGRLGGAEVSYGSDADVMFVHRDIGDDEQLASSVAGEVAARLRTLLGRAVLDRPAAGGRRRPAAGGAQRPARPLHRVVCAVLRPLVLAVGGAGAAARPPVAGDADLGAEFVAMIDPVRYPADGVPPATSSRSGG